MITPVYSALSILLICLQQYLGVEQLTEYPIPATTEVLSGLNSKPNYQVYVGKGKVLTRIEKYTNHKGPVTPFKLSLPPNYVKMGMSASTLTFKVHDGWLVAYNMGEWGGLVYWYDKSGGESYLIEKLSNVLEFITIDSKIYAVAGLAHGDSSDGSISEITRQNGKWVKIDHIKLPHSPQALSLLPDKSILIITTDQLIRVKPDKSIAILIENGFWMPYLHPKSLAVSGNTIYAGMAGGVMKTWLDNPGKQVWMHE
ncbi:MAG: hypothetical protein V4721_00120 [Bacteroidota bacterium]